MSPKVLSCTYLTQLTAREDEAFEASSAAEVKRNKFGFGIAAPKEEMENVAMSRFQSPAAATGQHQQQPQPRQPHSQRPSSASSGMFGIHPTAATTPDLPPTRPFASSSSSRHNPFNNQPSSGTNDEATKPRPSSKFGLPRKRPPAAQHQHGDINDATPQPPVPSSFKTAHEQLMIDQMRQNNRQVGSYDPAASVFKKSLGVARPPGTSSSFKPPFATNTTPESTAAYEQAVEYYMKVQEILVPQLWTSKIERIE